DISLPFHQVEGIATTDGLKYYISNEYFRLMNIRHKLHIINLSSFLQHYLKPGTPPVNQTGKNKDYKVYLIPGDNCMIVKKEENDQNEDYSLISLSGQTVLRGKLNGKENMINISHLTSGLYVFKIGKNPSSQVKLIKI
ncbi:MAG: T9SS type A sorting domain-containing protein, partial [Bacteroidales bacterium]|nr:T9SS type A sorting domain-containing protein [Bacteroidales bacterium]